MENTNLPTMNLIFNRNEHTNKWYCFRREDYNTYFNYRNNPDAKIAEGDTAALAFESWNKEYGNAND